MLFISTILKRNKLFLSIYFPLEINIIYIIIIYNPQFIKEQKTYVFINNILIKYYIQIMKTKFK